MLWTPSSIKPRLKKNLQKTALGTKGSNFNYRYIVQQTGCSPFESLTNQSKCKNIVCSFINKILYVYKTSCQRKTLNNYWIILHLYTKRRDARRKYRPKEVGTSVEDKTHSNIHTHTSKCWQFICKTWACATVYFYNLDNMEKKQIQQNFKKSWWSQSKYMFKCILYIHQTI